MPTCDLADKTCEPCRGGVPPLSEVAAQTLLKELSPGWMIWDNHHLEKEISFADFRSALDFTNLAGELAETEGHHPDIALSWGRVVITLWTHKIDGLSEADFILAAKIDKLSPTGE